MIGRNLLLLIKMIIIERKGLIVLVVRNTTKSLFIEMEGVKFNLPPPPFPPPLPPLPPLITNQKTNILYHSSGINCTNYNLKTNKIKLLEKRVLCFSCFNDLRD